MRIQKSILITLVAMSIVGITLSYINWNRGKLLKKQKMYAYLYYGKSKRLTSVLLLENMKYKETYINYYKEVLQGKTDVTINDDMPIKGLSTSEPVYIIDYSSDSLLVKIVSLAPTPLKLGNSYREGWVYAQTLHLDPPKK